MGIYIVFIHIFSLTSLSNDDSLNMVIKCHVKCGIVNIYLV